MNHLWYFWYGLKKIYNPVIEDMDAREQRKGMLDNINKKNGMHAYMNKNPVEAYKELYVSKVKNKKIVRCRT